MRGDVAIVGYGRTPYSRAKPGEPVLTVDDYIAWAAELALQKAGMTKGDFDGQGLGVSHAEVAHTVNWSAATAENLGISPQVLIRADQGGASASAMLIRAAAMIRAGIVDRVLVVGADTPLNMPSVAPGLPLSPERTRGVYWDFQGPFGVMGATAQFALVLTRYMHQYPRLEFAQLGKIAVTNRFHASLHAGAIYRKPFTLDEYLASRVLSDPIRLLDCVPIVNGGLAYIVTSAETARTITDRPVYLLGCGEANNYYHGSRSLPDITTTGFAQAAPQAMAMAGVRHEDIQFLQPYDDYPFISMMTIEDFGFCRKGEGGRFVEEHDLRFDGRLSAVHRRRPALRRGSPVAPTADSCRWSKRSRSCAARPAIARSRMRVGAACGFGGIPYGRPGRSCVALILGTEA